MNTIHKTWMAGALFLAMTSFAHAQCQEQSFDLAPDWNAIYSPVDSTHSGIATLAASTQVQKGLS